MTKQRFTLRAAVYLLLFKDEQILLLRRYQTGYKDGWYSLVAGHLDGDESVFQAMIREAKEEAGLTIQEKDLSVAHVMHRKSNVEYIDFYLIAKQWEGEPTIGEPEKCDDLRWFSVDALPETIVDEVKQAILSVRKSISFSSIGWS